MKNLKRMKGKRIMAGTLSLLILVLFVAPYQLTAKVGVCDEALEDCAIDVLIISFVAFLAGLGGGPGAAFAGAGAVAAGYSGFCLIGFAFCKTYVVR